ncbi:MAG: NlpC/P60 family protein [Prolixibacteraceae bacterium]
MQKRISILILFLLIASIVQSRVQAQEAAQKINEKSAITIDREELISFAKKYLGTPYHYASSNPKKGFDCSGFVNFVFNNFHVSLPRSSRDFKSMGKDLKPEEFKEGDVVVFYSFRNKARIGHVGIISEAKGLRSKFIHSASGQKRGIVISELGEGLYATRFFRCIDVIGKN